ncbi:hypothetical protein [Synechococcus sp. BIOS-U3-1]|nr:hypothetical protein [Synechococcus sp. BIOS-U3-1]
MCSIYGLWTATSPTLLSVFMLHDGCAGARVLDRDAVQVDGRRQGR